MSAIDRATEISTTPDALIELMTQRIVSSFHPLRIILFGSHARGDAGPDSDVDLLVVLLEASNKREAAIRIRRLLADLPVCKDIIVTTPEEIAERGDIVGTALRPALREGRVLYEQRAGCEGSNASLSVEDFAAGEFVRARSADLGHEKRGREWSTSSNGTRRKPHSICESTRSASNARRRSS